MVGSTRPAKVEGVRAALNAIAAIDARFLDATLEPLEVADVAPPMPMTERDIVEGACVRARTLLGRAAPSRDDMRVRLAIGLEGGLDPLPDGSGRHALKTWAAATDGVRWGYGAGGAIVLPDELTRRVLAGHELGDVIDEIAGAPVRGTRGTWGVLTRDLVGRREAFTFATLAALAPFYNARLYDV